MKYLLILSSFLVSLTYSSSNAQIYNDFYNDMVNNVSNVNLVDDITVFQNFGVKEPGTAANNNTKDWIVSRYTDLGYTDIVEQPFTVSGNVTNNVIITKTGLVYPNTYLIIDGHYDTVNGPGANDNGTGTVLILELARILKDIDTEYSIKFIHFSGEEAGLIGSEFYVNNTVIPQNLDISLVFNIDEIGGINGMTNNTIVCERDENNNPSSNNAASAAATEILANSIELYSNLLTEISYAYGSDYIPFEDNGEIITGLYEKNESPYAHTSNDIIANMDLDYLFEITKGALGASLHFAVGVEPISGISDNGAPNTIGLYPNPVDHTLYLQNVTQEKTISIYSIIGQKVIECNINASNNAIDVSNLSKGIYFIRSANSNSAIKFIKE